MRIRFVKPYFMYAKGEIITPDKPIRDIMLARGICEIVVDNAEEQTETAAMNPPETASVNRGNGKHRGFRRDR